MSMSAENPTGWHGPAASSKARLLLSEPALFQHRFHVWFFAQPRLIQCAELFGVPARQNHLAEAIAVGAGEAAVVFEPLVGVVIEHFAPQIGVVARCVSG